MIEPKPHVIELTFKLSLVRLSSTFAYQVSVGTLKTQNQSKQDIQTVINVLDCNVSIGTIMSRVS